MTKILEKLKSHKENLIRIKGSLWWYGSKGFENVSEKTLLVIDAKDRHDLIKPNSAPLISAATASCSSSDVDDISAALLLIDEQLHWVWVANEDIDFL